MDLARRRGAGTAPASHGSNEGSFGQGIRPHQRRRWDSLRMPVTRFRIGTLMIAVAVVGVGFAIPWSEVLPFAQVMLMAVVFGLVLLAGLAVITLILSPFLWAFFWLLDRCLSAYRYRD